MLKFPSKRPDEVLDYAVDWSARVGDDEITEATAERLSDRGPAVRQNDIDGTQQTIWLEGGTANSNTSILITARTAGGRVMQEEVGICITD